MFKRILLLTIALCAALAALPASVSSALAANANTYYIEVDIANQITTVYRRSDNAIVRQMICSSGTGDRTPRGLFRMEQTRESTDRKPWYYISNYRCYVKYATRIKGGILFHSIPYAAMDMDTIDREALAQLGTKASHGCIRLRWQDAQWIAMNCPDGTAVNIFTGAAAKERLRQLLLLEGYSEDCGLTYAQFLDTYREDDGSGSLVRGATGKAVSALQRKLTGLGFYSGASPSGVYDTATIVAVMRYQAAANLPATGVATKELVRRIRGERELVAEYATLVPGVEGTLVARFQRAMRDVGFYTGDIDGSYNRALGSAVLTYCECVGVEPTEQVSPSLRADVYALLRQLNRRYGRGAFTLAVLREKTFSARTNRGATLYDTASPLGKLLATIEANRRVRLLEQGDKWSRVRYGGKVGYVPTDALTVTVSEALRAHWGVTADEIGVAPMNRDSVGNAVLALKNRLLALGFFTGESSPVYDAQTVAAVRAYQETAGLNTSGRASVRLQNAIFESDDITGTRVTLSRGMEGPAVAALQRALSALGYFGGKCNGRYAGDTVRAVEAFTGDSGMEPTGVATPQVQRAVFDRQPVSGNTASVVYGEDEIELHAPLTIEDEGFTGLTIEE